MLRPFSDVDLHAYVDGQVGAERRALIDAYLKTTPAEAARVDLWRRQNEAIRCVFAGAASEPVPLWLTIGQVASGRRRPASALRDPVQDNRARPTGQRGGKAIPARQRQGRSWKPACLVVAAFVFGVAVPYGLAQGPSGIARWMPTTPRAALLGRVAARTIEAQRVYGDDPEQPVEVIDAPPGRLAAWLKLHVGGPVRVPDLRRDGWTLRGGRVAPGEAGRRAALIVYEDGRGDRLSLVATPVDNPAPSDTTYAVMDGSVLAWLDGPVGFGIATSREGPWLADNARGLYHAIYADAAD